MSANARKFQKIWIWIILLVLLQSCGTSPFATDSRTPAVEPAVTEIDELSIVTPAFSGTKTPTITVFVAPTATRTIRPPITPTVFPTRYIPEEEIKAYWQNVVATNGGCDLPCFLGLQPGISSGADLEKLHAPVLDGGFNLPEPWIDPYWYEIRSICLSGCYGHDLIYNIRVGDGIIQYISVRTQMIGQDPEIAKALDAYRLDEILAKYGEPSRVLLLLKPFPNHRDAEPEYFLYVFYDDKGILLHYWGYSVTILGSDQSVARVCPNFDQLITFDLFLRSENDPTPLDELTVGTGVDLMNILPGLNLQPRPIESVTDLSIAEFYNRLKTPDACFDSPTGIWR